MTTSVHRQCAALLFIGVGAIPGVVVADAYTFDKCTLERQCRRVSAAELGRMRGGFSFTSANGLVEITFGISQVAYVNNPLVALTQLMLPGGVAALNVLSGAAGQQIVQGNALAAVSSGTTVPVGAGNAAASTAGGIPAAVAPVGATTSVPSAPAAVPTTAVPQVTGASATQPLPAAAAGGSAAAVAATSNPSPATTTTVNGTPVTPGAPVANVPNAAGLASLVVQNGPGNSVAPTALDLRNGSMAVVIQNSLNNQTIRTLTVMNLSMRINEAVNAAALQRAVRESVTGTTK